MDTNGTIAERSANLAEICLAIAEHAPLPMVSVDGATHVVRYSNPAFCILMGLPAEQLAGKALDDLLPTRDKCLTLLDRVFRTQRPESFTEEERAGSQPVFWSYTGWPLIGGEGLIGVMIQVTETVEGHGKTIAVNEALLLGSIRQHELRAEAESSNLQLQSEMLAHGKTSRTLAEKARLLDLTNDAIIVCTAEHAIRFWNKGAEKLYGWTFDEAAGHDHHRLLQTEFPVPMEAIVELLAGEGQYVGEVVQTARDGRRIPLLCRWVQDEETQSVLTSYTDISERRALEESLKTRAADLLGANRKKDEFLAMLAHELRNPLSSIGNAVAVLREANRDTVPVSTNSDDPATKDRAREARDVQMWANDVISRQTVQLARLVDDLLDVSRITLGKIDLRRARLDVAGILANAAETVAPYIAAREHALLVDYPVGELWIEGDPTRVEQIVVNLLTNAGRYTEPHGEIFLKAWREHREIVITVRDTGLGIAPEHIPAMFDLFTQGDRSPARSEGGLGIGLTVVRGLCELHGGSIVAHSEGPGTGSTFTVRLPAYDLAEQAIPPQDVSAGFAGTHAARILIVDDNADTASGLSRLLVRRGYEVVIAYDGISALDRANEFCPEAVLLDIGLPGLDGYEVARRLRGSPCAANLLIVAITGYSQEDDRTTSRAAGCDHHLVKPVAFETVQDILTQHFAVR